jgi:hypothetical protein
LALPTSLQPQSRWARGPLSVPCRSGTPAYRLDSKIRKMYCHMPYITGSCLPAREGSDAATCPATLDPASLFGRAPTLPCVPRLRILPPYSEGSDAAMCPAALDPASLLGRAPMLPRVLRLRILPPCLRGLRCCHMSCGFGSYLPAREGSDAATCPTASGPASLLGRAPALQHIPQLCGPQTSRIKKGLNGLSMRLDSRVFNACPHVTEMPDT